MSAPNVEVICNLMMSGSREEFYDQILTNRRYCAGPHDVVTSHSHLGKSVAICGAGPSLGQSVTELADGHYDEVWGCNRARNWLSDHGHRITHGFAIDQGIDMLKPNEWRRVLPMDYYLASSVHPLLTRRIARKHQRIIWFHNYLGMPNPEGWVDPPSWKKPPEVDPKVYTGKELWLYCTKWPSTVQTGYGLNAVPRAICLALFMGFTRIDVYGADCGAAPDAPAMPAQDNPAYVDWLQQVVLYVGGESVLDTYGPQAIMVETELGYHRWHTRPDMLVSARHLVDMVRAFDGTNLQHGVASTVTLKGDTLASTLCLMPPEYFATMPNLNGAGAVVGLQAHPDLLRSVREAETLTPTEELL